MTKSVSFAVLAGALLIAVALGYHGRQLARVSNRLETLEKRSTELEGTLEKFTDELPQVIGLAGKDAGRQAFQGAVEEAVQLPMNLLRPVLTRTERVYHGKPSLATNSPGAPQTDSAPYIRFDLPYMTINFNVGELPSGWPFNNQIGSPTNFPNSAGQPPGSKD
jgi:hypothetical protein